MNDQTRVLTVSRPYWGDADSLTMFLAPGENPEVGELVVLDGGSVQSVPALLVEREGRKVRLVFVTQSNRS